ncbi:MAG: histidinol dehydrogenase [Nitrososphaerales archaeon]
MRDKSSIKIRRFTVAEKTNTVSQIVEQVRRESSNGSNFHVSSTVSEILSLVSDLGDEALIKLANKFDGSNFKSGVNLFVTREEFSRAYSKVKPQHVLALKKSREQIKWLAAKQMQRFKAKKLLSPLGFEINERYVPIQRVGGYIPGGRAAYPSTVLMICAPANEAGVKQIILATPAPGGEVNPSVLVAADICGVNEVIKVGGAQAIAALSFGTKTIKKVELIAGPGNEYVTEAKRQVSSSGAVSIDSLAGPTELLVIADASSDPRLVFEDLISQAEHGNKTLCGLVSDSPKIIKAVMDCAKNTRSRARFDKISHSLLFTVLVRCLAQAVEFAQEFAPEHLEVIASKSLEEGLTRSGLVLSGKFTPCSATDYIVGTNHILPTGGTASRKTGLSVETFLKRVTIVRGSKKSLERSANFISDLADMEGLPNHGLAARARFEAREC